MSVSPAYAPCPVTDQLSGEFWDEVEVARFPEHRLRFRNDRWARRIGLDTLSDSAWEAHFARFAPLPDNLRAPLALRYHGHQFRVYNPRLGDGRGFLFAQLRDASDQRLLDLGTKGTGTTPHSRGGDGRLTLKGGVREILATEMLEALGVYTSKSLSLYETGEHLHRGDEPSPTRSSVLVRLGHSHVRFGSFQRHAHLGNVDALRQLVEFVIEHYMPEHANTADPVAAMFASTVRLSARLVAQWMIAGFVHGVLNTDNMNITGESFDYGPYRFLPTYDPDFVAAYFDHTGLYAFRRQPDAVLWNLGQLADALSPICPESALKQALDGYDEHLHGHVLRAFVARLGVCARDDDHDADLLNAAYAFLAESQMDYGQFFFDWYGGPASEQRATEGPAARAYDSEACRDFRLLVADYEPAAGALDRLGGDYFARTHATSLLIGDIEALWLAIDQADDWRPFAAKVEEIRVMGQALGLQELQAE